MCSIMNNTQSMVLCETLHLIVVAENAVIVHHNEGFRTWRHETPSRFQVNAKGVIIDVTKDRLGAGGEDRLKIRGIVEGRRDDFIAGANARKQKPQMESGMSSADRDDVTILHA